MSYYYKEEYKGKDEFIMLVLNLLMENHIYVPGTEREEPSFENNSKLNI